MTRPYHGNHADRYAAATWGVDLRALRTRFICALPDRSSGRPRLLDVGCGSGRDALAFSAEGFLVDAMDASPDMATIAAERTRLPVTVGRAQDIHGEALYDGIWACASLLHVPLSELPEAFRRLRTALVPGGVLYASFKWGDRERLDDGLHFTDLTPESAARLVEKIPDLVLEETWASEDARPERAGQRWLNLLARRPNQATSLE